MRPITVAENDTYVVKALPAAYDTRATKTRIYTNIDPESIGLEAPKVYGIRGEDPEIDKAWDQYNRKVVKAMKEQIIAADAELHFLPEDGFKMTFSRTAGCSCGCSPAFILQTSMNSRLAAPESMVDDLGFANTYLGVAHLWIDAK